MYWIVEVDGKVRQTIDEKGKANRYGKPRFYADKADAQAYVDKHTYKGMTHHYEISEVPESEYEYWRRH